jgi:hypothetical protein
MTCSGSLPDTLPSAARLREPFRGPGATLRFNARITRREGPQDERRGRMGGCDPDDSHALVPLAALPDGLRFVVPPLSLQRLPIATLAEGVDAAAVMTALATSEAQYSDAARSLHLPEALPEVALERAARFARNTLKNHDRGVRILERNVALHPGSARAVARLAEGYAATGDAAALAQLRRAIALDRSSATELPPDARTKLRELERKTSRK